MFKIFKGGKTPPVLQSEAKTLDINMMSDAKQQLFAQLKAKREELGQEEIAKMQKALEMQAMRKKVKHAINNDDISRQRLLDDIRFHMQQDK